LFSMVAFKTLTFQRHTWGWWDL